MNITELFFLGLAIVSLIGFLITLVHHRNYRKQHSQHGWVFPPSYPTVAFYPQEGRRKTQIQESNELAVHRLSPFVAFCHSLVKFFGCGSSAPSVENSETSKRKTLLLGSALCPSLVTPKWPKAETTKGKWLWKIFLASFSCFPPCKISCLNFFELGSFGALGITILVFRIVRDVT